MMANQPPPVATGNRSEVARLMEQIDREIQSMNWAMTGLAEGTAKHLFINRRYQKIGERQGELAAFVGDQRAIDMVCERMQ